MQLRIICLSSSPWSSPLHMFPKKNSRDLRPCGEYRSLNNIRRQIAALFLASMLHCIIAWSHSFKKNWLGTCIPSNSDRTQRHSEDSSHYTIWSTYIIFCIFHLDFATQHSHFKESWRGFAWTWLLFWVHRWPANCKCNPNWTPSACPPSP